MSKYSEILPDAERRAALHDLTWLRDAYRNAKLMDDKEEIRVLSLAMALRADMDRDGIVGEIRSRKMPRVRTRRDTADVSEDRLRIMEANENGSSGSYSGGF